MRSHSSYLFDIGQSLLLDFGSLVRSHSSHSSCLFHTGQLLLVDFGLCDPALPLVLSFSTLVSRCCWTLARLCAPTHPTRLVFFTLVSYCWWTLACAILRFHSSCLFRHWSVVVGGLWLVRSQSSSFFTLVSRCWWTLACALPLVLSF